MSFSIEKYCFRPVSFFENLEPPEQELLEEQMKTLQIAKNKILFREGYPSTGVYILKEGHIKIFQMNKDGQEQIAYICGRGEIIGYRPLLSNSTHPATAATLDDCILEFIPEKSFTELLNRSAMLTKKLLLTLAHEFSVWINTISILAQQPVRERIALVLLILNEKYKTAGEANTEINISRRNFAAYARTTIETLARTLTQLKKEKIIRIEGRKITLLKVAAIEQMVEK